jgi:predicted nucleotidyltransferase
VQPQEIVKTIVDRLEPEPYIEGAFLSGSLVNENRDRFSDVDLGIASQNNPEAAQKAYSLRHHLVNAVGQPVQFVERGWHHCQMIAVLYGKSQFPPIGIEVNLVFRQITIHLRANALCSVHGRFGPVWEA